MELALLIMGVAMHQLAPSPWNIVGFWMAVAMGLAMAFQILLVVIAVIAAVIENRK